MYKNKSEHGLNNICGQKIRKLRLEMKSGKRFITDIELKALAKVLNVTYAELLD